MQGGKQPNAKQKRWHEWLREQGCSNPVCSCNNYYTAVHHCCGSTGKHNKVHIGQDWVLNLCYDCHQGPDGIHHSCEAFNTDESRKQIEKRLFIKMVTLYEGEFNEPPCSLEVISAIMDYRR